jgi:hypothetical protein
MAALQLDRLSVKPGCTLVEGCLRAVGSFRLPARRVGRLPFSDSLMFEGALLPLQGALLTLTLPGGLLGVAHFVH